MAVKIDGALELARDSGSGSTDLRLGVESRAHRNSKSYVLRKPV